MELTPARRKCLIRHCGLGLSLRAAAFLEDVEMADLARWLGAGYAERARLASGAAPRESESEYLQLLEGIDAAEAAALID